MALQLGALRDALEAAGADREMARKAAEEVVGYQGAITTLKLDLADVKADVRLSKWMLGANTALILLIVGILLRLPGLVR